MRPTVSRNSLLDNYFYGDSKGWARRFCSFMCSCLPGIMNPHALIIQQWNQFFVFSTLFSIFIDPLFFFVISTRKDDKCIVMNKTIATFIAVFSSLTDLIYFLHIVVQIIVFFVLPRHLSSSGANHAKNLIRTAVLVRYIPKMCRFLPTLAGGGSSIGFRIESSSVHFVINLLTFILVGHIVGSFWYLFGLQRVNECLQEVCNHTAACKFMNCGSGNVWLNHSDPKWVQWNETANNACLIMGDGGLVYGDFEYGIYQQVVSLTTKPNVVTRYVYSLFWGFQQISTLAGNQVPSYSTWEVLFTMAITGIGLLLFALLIGNMQYFLQSLGQRKLEMSLRLKDIEQWMNDYHLPDDLRRMMKGPILDSICERLRQKTYIGGSRILYPGDLIEKMVFILRGQIESIGEDGVGTILAENDLCGDQLLIWFLDNSQATRDEKIKERPHSTKAVRCVTNVKAFILRAEDLEEVTKRFSRFFRNPQIQRAVRYETPYWRRFAATVIQVAWRYRKKQLNRAKLSSQSSRAE